MVPVNASYHQDELLVVEKSQKEAHIHEKMDVRFFSVFLWADLTSSVGERSERGQATASAGMEGGEVLGTFTVPENQHPLSV